MSWLSSMFGGGSDSTAEMKRMQDQEALEARIKEEARQKRIDNALAKIKDMFQGERIITPGATKTFDWKTFKPPTQDEITRIYAGETKYLPGMQGISYQQAPDGTWTLRQGKKIFKPGEALSYQAPGVDTGKRKPSKFGEDFYGKLRSGIEGYYQPQVAEKYADARDETTYRLADAGTLKSSAALAALADLLKQNAIQTGNVHMKADTAAADLRKRVHGEETNAINQVYSVENPNVAVSNATNAIRDISPAPMDLSPLGDIFNLAAIGAAGAVQGYQDQKFINQNQDIFNKTGSGRVINV